MSLPSVDTRRIWLPQDLRRLVALGALLTVVAPILSACAMAPLTPEMTERRLATAVHEAGLPGATFAVLASDRLIHCAAVGVADRNSATALPPSALMRIASVSKPITATAVLRLVDQGHLDLDAPVLPYLSEHLGPDFVAHPAYARLSARELLRHCGGWDRSRSFDPMLATARMMKILGLDRPPTADEIVAWALATAPSASPGRSCVYSNLGYAVLGRLIEAVTGQDYEVAVGELVLHPAGLDTIRLAASLPSQRHAREPRYHDARQVRSLFDPERIVDLPDGGLHLAAMDAHGGWIASAADLVNLLAAIEGRGRPPLLAPDKLRQMRRVRPAAGEPHGLGWHVDRGGRYGHGGNLPGSVAMLWRERDGTIWALLGNGSVDEPAAMARLERRVAGLALALARQADDLDPAATNSCRSVN